jgi:protein-S-isoprenylcysteine O-methyltransferase Ste14
MFPDILKKLRCDKYIENNSQPIASGLVGLTVFITCFILAKNGIALNGTFGFVYTCILMALSIAAVDILIYRTYLQPDVGKFSLVGWSSRASIKILILKSIALIATLILIGAYYLLFPIYRESLYLMAFGALQPFVLWFLFFFIVYMLGAHIILEQKEDSFSNFGLFLVSLGKQGDKSKVRDYLLALLIKLFFVPLMLGYGLRDWAVLTTNDQIFESAKNFGLFAYGFLFLIDLSFVTLGYCCAFRLLNAHVRWPERKLGGWLVCLMCYMPFWQILSRNFFSYGDETTWGTILQHSPILYAIYGCTILLLVAIYTWSSVSFGLRFSNLTYRGLVKNGPYAITRHPAYISKNLSWWLIDLPFINGNPLIAISNVFGLLCINAIYYGRAKYEEKCCGLHEDYQEYSRSISNDKFIDKFKRMFKA